MSLSGNIFSTTVGFWMNWPLWGGLLAMLLLAQHFWVLFAPLERALPGNTAISSTALTGQLFGTSDGSNAATSSLDGMRPIGIFAHATRGFAVMQTPNGQRGVGLGSEVAPGIRLVETHTDHVILERNGSRQRVDLTVPTATVGISPAQTAATRQTETRISAGTSLQESLAPEQQLMMKNALINNHGGQP